MQSNIRRQVYLTLITTVFLFSFVNLSLEIPFVNVHLKEPNDWGSRDDIAFKINDCKELFSSEENAGKYHVVIIGDSRVQQAADPRIIDSYFNHTTISYNHGYSATSVTSQALLLKNLIVPKFRPRFLIWDLSPSDFYYNTYTLNRYNDVIHSPMGRYYSGDLDNITYDEFMEYLLLKSFPLYRYRVNFQPESLNLTDTEAKYGYFKQGFWETHSNSFTTNYTSLYYVNITIPFDPRAEELFFDALNFLNSSGIPYLIVVHPKSYKVRYYEPFEEVLSRLPQDRVMDLRGNLSLVDPSLYYNYGHLNYDGAKIYTQFLCDYMDEHKIVEIFS